MRLITLLSIGLFTLSIYAQPSNSLLISISGNTGSDQTVLSFEPNASAHFDNGFDVEKVFTSNQNAPQVFTVDQNQLFYSVNAVEEGAMLDTLIPIFLNTSVAGIYQIQLTELTSFAPEFELYLIDTYSLDTLAINGNVLHTVVRLAENVFDVIQPDLIVWIKNPTSLENIKIQKTNTSCLNTSNGTIEITTNLENVQLFFLNQDLLEVDSVWLSPSNNHFSNFAAGIHYLKFERGYDSSLKTVHVGSDDSSSYHLEVVNINMNSFSIDVKANTSLNVFWDFGDQQTSTNESETHFYAAAGEYIVKLDVSNVNCAYRDSIVIDFISFNALNEETNAEMKNIHYSKENGLLFFDANDIVDVKVFSISGALLDQLNSGSLSALRNKYYQQTIVVKYKSQRGQWHSQLLTAQ